jgi:hypothetical protein
LDRGAWGRACAKTTLGEGLVRIDDASAELATLGRIGGIHIARGAREAVEVLLPTLACAAQKGAAMLS